VQIEHIGEYLRIIFNIVIILFDLFDKSDNNANIEILINK